ARLTRWLAQRRSPARAAQRWIIATTSGLAAQVEARSRELRTGQLAAFRALTDRLCDWCTLPGCSSSSLQLEVVVARAGRLLRNAGPAEFLGRRADRIVRPAERIRMLVMASSVPGRSVRRGGQRNRRHGGDCASNFRCETHVRTLSVPSAETGNPFARNGGP